MFPFDSDLYKFIYKGKDLLNLLQRIQNGKKGLYPTDGIIMYASFL
jgi:hypothetical protein